MSAKFMIVTNLFCILVVYIYALSNQQSKKA